MFEDKIAIIDDALRKVLRPGYPEIIFEAMSYSVFTGGKRIRPLTAMAACEACGGSTEDVLPFACALELIHTYSLIHDDLPAMDNDDFRRGKPTSHKAFGEAIAILAGDALLSLAFEVMSEACVNNNSVQRLEAMRCVASASGVYGMLGGQVVDICSENKNISKDTLIYMHEHKTAALFKAAMTAGALAAGAQEDTVCELERAGLLLGTAFQIKDDILDVTSSPEELGKPINSDAKSQKQTYVTVFGMERAIADYERVSSEVELILEGLRLKNSFLPELVNRIFLRRN